MCAPLHTCSHMHDSTCRAYTCMCTSVCLLHVHTHAQAHRHECAHTLFPVTSSGLGKVQAASTLVLVWIENSRKPAPCEVQAAVLGPCTDSNLCLLLLDLCGQPGCLMWEWPSGLCKGQSCLILFDHATSMLRASMGLRRSGQEGIRGP